jgi:F-type H+-transporting ATPase subunit epsilon
MKVTVMAEITEKAEDIDIDRAAAKVAEAERQLQTGGLSSDLKEAQISLEKARLRKKIAERTRRSHST